MPANFDVKTNIRNFCIGSSCKVMPMCEITTSHSFTNEGKRYKKIIKLISDDPRESRKWHAKFKHRIHIDTL